MDFCVCVTWVLFMASPCCFHRCRIGFVYDSYVFRARTYSQQMLALKSRGSGELMLDMLFAAAVPMIISGVAMEWRRVHPRIFRFFTNWVMWGWKPKFVRTIEYEKASHVDIRRNRGGVRYSFNCVRILMATLWCVERSS